MKNTNKAIDLDPILLEIGTYGKFQIINYVVLSTITIVALLPFLSYVFAAAQLEYR